MPMPTSNDPKHLRNVSDTAVWMAHYRAVETERPDAYFRDPLASRFLAGHAERLKPVLHRQKRNEWAFLTRTLLFDDVVNREVAEGADMVINLAAGLDTRPYRMDLPSSLRWVEVDLPALVEEKNSILADETPRCRLERVALDLSDADGRRALFARLGAEAKRAVILSEGLLIYLGDEGAAGVARDLAAQPAFARWAFDLASPGLRDMLNREVGKELNAAEAPLKFAPANGPLFFASLGWRVIEARSFMKNARRLPLFFKLFQWLPDPPIDKQGKRPWSAVCLLQRDV
jgi:methyltransferase (TIGR00027 family)